MIVRDDARKAPVFRCEGPDRTKQSENKAPRQKNG